MTDRDPDSQQPRATTVHTYRERLYPAWWMWPLGLAFGVIVVTELSLASPVLARWYSYLAVSAVVALALWRLGRITIRVDQDHLRVDDATLPVSAIGSVRVLDTTARRELLGVDADPLAFVVQRPWIPGGIRVEVTDPQDPTPYWFISSRHPQALADSLVGALSRR